MNLKRISLTYVVTYLMIGGLGLAVVPDLFLKLFQSNQDYGDIMPRVAGMFMIALGGLLQRYCISKTLNIMAFR